MERLASSAQWFGDVQGTKKAFDFAYNSGNEHPQWGLVKSATEHFLSRLTMNVGD